MLCKSSVTLILIVQVFYGIIDMVQTSPIVGGQPIPANDKTFSFAVSLQFKEIDKVTGEVTYRHFCGGVLLQVHNGIGYIITASHCISHIEPGFISVIFGAKNIRNYNGIRYDNLTVHIHEYDRYTLEGDFSMITVFFNDTNHLTLNPIRMIVDQVAAISDSCYIYGYGSESLHEKPTLELKLAPVTIIPYELCAEKLGPYNSPEPTGGMFCASGAYRGVDACAGDSGSALFCVHEGQLAIVGIISYGLGCGVTGMPGVYTSVAHHVRFIRDVVRVIIPISK